MADPVPFQGKLDSGWLRLPATQKLKIQLGGMVLDAQRRLYSASSKSTDPEVREAYAHMRQIEAMATMLGIPTETEEFADD